jgi:hypothetical protein
MGCSGNADRVPVSGIVTFNGKPVSNARIVATPVLENSASPLTSSYGITDEKGFYSLRSIKNDQSGAVVGLHRIRIVKVDTKYKSGETDVPEDITSRLPPKATDGSITLEIPPKGTTSANFEF